MALQSWTGSTCEMPSITHKILEAQKSRRPVTLRVARSAIKIAGKTSLLEDNSFFKTTQYELSNI
jgi:hypothetical protein